MSAKRAMGAAVWASILIVAGVAGAQASIVWSAPVPVSGPSDVSTVGAPVIAVNCGPGASLVTLNGVTFLPDPTPGNFQTQPSVSANGYTLDMPYNRVANGNFWSNPAPGGSAALGQALDRARHQGPGMPDTVMCSISGLTVGNVYEVQVWSADDRGGPGWRVSDWGDTCGAAGAGLSGHSVTGIFSATSTSQSFCNGPQAGISFNLLNLIQVRVLSVLPEYQTNWTEAGFDVDGVQGTPSAPATVTVPVATWHLVNLSSTNVGQPWDLVWGMAPLVPLSAGGLATPLGQIVNLDLADPTLGLWFNFLLSPPFVNGSVPFRSPVPISLSMQVMVGAPSMPSGIAISQPNRLIVQ